MRRAVDCSGGSAARRGQPPCVGRWQRGYAEGGVERLLREGSRKPGTPRTPLDVTAKVVALTCAEPPGEVTHWTGRAMAAATGLPLSTIQRIWGQHNLQPHRLRTFKRSRDPALAAKVEDVVGLYMHPPARAVVLCIDEKCQIQALDRTQPGLPIKPGKCGTMTHDYKGHGTTTPFAALNVLDGEVIGRCMQKHTHQEFIRFLNAVENFFSVITRLRIRLGVFRSITDLQAAINCYIAEHIEDPKPFVWTKLADAIIAKIERLPVLSV